MQKHFIIRKGRIDDLPQLQKLFVDTVTTICKTDYNNDQIEAWTSDTKNNTKGQRWLDIMSNQFVLVAQQAEKIIGFATLDSGQFIDLLYVHKDYQRQGVAGRLYADIENEAKRQKRTILTSDVSKTARPFFEKQKFKVVTEQAVNRKSVILTNYKMTKTLD